jgi:hypothetical protein
MLDTVHLLYDVCFIYMTVCKLALLHLLVTGFQYTDIYFVLRLVVTCGIELT